MTSSSLLWLIFPFLLLSLVLVVMVYGAASRGLNFDLALDISIGNDLHPPHPFIPSPCIFLDLSVCFFLDPFLMTLPKLYILISTSCTNGHFIQKMCNYISPLHQSLENMYIDTCFTIHRPNLPESSSTLTTISTSSATA